MFDYVSVYYILFLRKQFGSDLMPENVLKLEIRLDRNIIKKKLFLLNPNSLHNYFFNLF